MLKIPEQGYEEHLKILVSSTFQHEPLHFLLEGVPYDEQVPEELQGHKKEGLRELSVLRKSY